MRVRWSWGVSVVPLLVSGWMGAGCATAAPKVVTTNEAPTPTDEASVEIREHHRHHHHGGIAMFVALAVDSLGLPPEKEKQAEQIQSDLKTALTPARNAEHDLIETLADGVASGSIDTATVGGEVAREESVAMSVHRAAAEAENRLHALLSPEERIELVNKVQSHWTIWKRVNCEEKPGSDQKESHLSHLTAELELTPGQVHQIEEQLHGSEKNRCEDLPVMQAEVDAFTQAFLADTFDAHSLRSTNPANSAIAGSGAARMAHFYEVVAPVLTPEQRTLLAEHLRAQIAPAPAATK